MLSPEGEALHQFKCFDLWVLMTRFLKMLFAFSSPLNNHAGYRSDIDGLRAVAVGLVVGFHAFPNYFPGGFIGVDIFFVISGYLISGIIFTQLEANRFSFFDFYAKRINRIFPALIAVLISCILLSKIYFFQNEVTSFNHSLIAAVAFIANIFFYGEAGYFDSAAETKPLLHLWSLGVEEQFYIIWPILLILLWKFRTMRPWMLAALIVFSISVNLLLVKTHQSAAFYLPISRFWELLLGSSLAYITIYKPQLLNLDLSQQHRWLIQNIAALLGFLLIILSLKLLNRFSAFPGWWALLPVSAAILIIAAGKDAWLNKFVLSNPMVVFIGVISYPIYLWHWPLLAFLEIEMGQTSKEIRVMAVLVSILLAWLTYLLIERPIRFNIQSPLKSAYISIALLFVGIYGYLDNRYANIDVDEKNVFVSYFTDYAKNNDLKHAHRYECSLTDVNGIVKTNLTSSCFESTTKQSLFIWGDSHAQHLNYGISKLLPKDISILQVATFGCAPSVGFIKTGIKSSCDASNQLALDKIKHAKPDIVLLAQRENHELNDWNELIETLKAAGVKNILILGPVPQWHQFLYRYYARHYWDTKPRRINTNLKLSIFQTDNEMKKLYGTSKDVTYISLIDRLCNTEGCLVYLGDNIETGLETFDYGHLSLSASEFLSKEALAPIILADLKNSL